MRSCKISVSNCVPCESGGVFDSNKFGKNIVGSTMFSFHKPKVYRSTSGCCICKAKSSSSRFTDSAKYEDDLMECFQLGEKRTGEICNACVLLVKRWKKLPAGSGRHWRHVVDYRAGPGSKSLVRSKTRNKKRPKLKAEVRSASPDGPDDELSSDLSVLSVLSAPNSPDEGCAKPRRKRELSCSKDDEEELYDSDFIDLTVWKRKKVCCGVIFTGPGGIVMIDPRMLKPCGGSCLTPKRVATPPPDPQPISDVAGRADSPISSEIAAHGSSSSIDDTCRPVSPPHSDIATNGGSTPCTTISDSSSDSGYDECSNPSAAAVVVPN